MNVAIWSASLSSIRAFPARTLLQFFSNHGLISLNDRPEWRTVEGGSVVYVKKLMSSFKDRFLLDVGARRISRNGETVLLEDSRGAVSNYDAVILVCHADQAIALIETPTAREQAVLGTFDYQSNETILHSDPKLMPRSRAVWPSRNYLADSAKSNEAKVSITYWMNHLQRLETDQLPLLSLNPLLKPDSEHLVTTTRYDHPIFDQKALEAQACLSEIQGRHRLWFADVH